MMMKRDQVLSTLRKHCQELSESYGIESLFIFGSVARNEARADSDVDILVEFKQPIGLFDFIGLQQRLESILGCKVDLGTKRSLKSQIYEEIIQEAIRVA